MKLIIGLGNPGMPYTKTRHNAGQRLVELLAEEGKLKWRSNRSLGCQYSESGEGESPFHLALPHSFMNESGKVVKTLVEYWDIDFRTELLVVVDDIALPFGKLRLRSKGQDGGHRGLRSIEQALGSQSYARLRIGIAPFDPEKHSPQALEKFVLQPFEPEEEKGLKEVLRRAATACRLWITGPIEKAMDWTNRPS